MKIKCNIFTRGYAIGRFKIIAKRGIIARSSYTKSYEKVDFLTFLYFLPATQKGACYRFLHILMESEHNHFHQNLDENDPPLW